MFILLDEENIVRCMASDVVNLHKDKINAGMTKIEVSRGGTVGDEYNPQTAEWIQRPENYPQPKESAIVEAKIMARIRKIAIDQLIAEGEIDAKYAE